MTKRWYVVQAILIRKSFKGLLERIEISNLKDQFGDVLVPVEEVVELKAGQKQ